MLSRRQGKSGLYSLPSDANPWSALTTILNPRGS
jgi:hypothetical protein